jgi:hypothetical protein
MMAGKCSAGACRRRLGEVDEVLGENARPHHVDLEHVDVVGFCRQKLLVERQLLAGRARRGDHPHRVAGALRPGLGPARQCSCSWPSALQAMAISAA